MSIKSTVIGISKVLKSVELNDKEGVLFHLSLFCFIFF
jgi:hypothetical protein